MRIAICDDEKNIRELIENMEEHAILIECLVEQLKAVEWVKAEYKR